MAECLEQSFEPLTELAQDIEFASVRRWKQGAPHRKAVAFFPVYAPMEIIHAAGMLPVGIAGAGDRLDLQHADSRFGSFICSIVKTTFELGITGKLEPFDALLFSTICDSARNLCFVMKRNFPGQHFEFLHLPHSTSESSIEFLAAEYRRLMGELQRIAGVEITAGALRNSIAMFNRQRELAGEIYTLRAEAPHLLRATESYALLRAGLRMPVEEHIAILEEMLPKIRARGGKKRDAIRVVIEGSFCEQPPLPLIRVLEAAGCDVVDDDFTLAQRWFSEPLPLEPDPVQTLAERYVRCATYSSVRHFPAAARCRGLEQRIRRSRADAVIFLIAKFCEPAYFDYVLFKKAVDQLGLPSLQLEFEEKLFTFDRLQTEIETFVESLIFD
ncbi:MAG: 2-hydroxyacyl-CoA dehydratase [Acidobacteria bacterium]|nr:2-hydroxyacyl-CoA dehydratase [Acidobacteriota bacterium]